MVAMGRALMSKPKLLLMDEPSMGLAPVLVERSFQIIQQVNGQPTSVPVTQLYYRTVYFWLILLLASPVITMRSFALEKDSGTFETLMTAPVSDRQVVTAKFAGALAFFVIIFQPLLICVLVLRHFAGAEEAFDYGLLAATGTGNSGYSKCSVNAFRSGR